MNIKPVRPTRSCTQDESRKYKGKMAVIAPRNSSPVIRDKENIPAYDVRKYSEGRVAFSS